MKKEQYAGVQSHESELLSQSKAPLSPLFLDQTEAEKSFFGDWASPLSQGLDDCPPPPPTHLSERLDPPLSVTSSTRYSELAGLYGIQFKI